MQAKKHFIFLYTKNALTRPYISDTSQCVA